MFRKEREFWHQFVQQLNENHDTERAAWDRERKELLERIQRPEFRPVEPGPVVEREPPKDAEELAYVGQLVPDGVKVGSSELKTEVNQMPAPVGELVTNDPRWRQNGSAEI